MIKIFNVLCTHCQKLSEVFFNDGVGKCPHCESKNLIKRPTKTGIKTQTSPNRFD